MITNVNKEVNMEDKCKIEFDELLVCLGEWSLKIFSYIKEHYLLIEGI